MNEQSREIPLIWIDADTGVDDAAALMTALLLEKKGLLKLMGISAVCGNVELEKTFENARNVLYMAGREDIKVWPGADRPRLVEYHPAYHVHGENGLGGEILQESPAPRETKPAWEALYECAKAHPGCLELVLIGPETNASIALDLYPDLAGLLKRILVMGGAEYGGNVTSSAEFNIWADPHAAQTVFKSGVPLVMCGLDVTMKAFLNAAEMKEIESHPGPGSRLISRASTRARELMRASSGEAAYVVHDACPVIYAVCPEIFTGAEAGVFVETRGPLTRGKTVSDRITDIKFGIKNATVVLDVDRERFAGIVREAITSV